MGVRRHSNPFVKNRTLLWELDALSTRYSQRPSSFFGLPAESWEAYQLDTAALYFGRWVDGKLGERDGKGKPVHRLSDLLKPPEKRGSAFRAMGGPGVRTVKIPESGVW